MPLPPELKRLTSQALALLTPSSATPVAAALLALVEVSWNRKFKSHEERFLDYVQGEIAKGDRRKAALEKLKAIASDPDLEHQRIFAKAAAEAVTGEFVMPVLEIAGPLVIDSRFERPGSPIWEMWKELLARACDASRAHEAHPAYMSLVKQLSDDEARILRALWPHAGLSWAELEARREPFGRLQSADLQITFPTNLRFYRVHLDSLGLTFNINLEGYKNGLLIDDQVFTHLTEVGEGFVRAVTPQGKGRS